MFSGSTAGTGLDIWTVPRYFVLDTFLPSAEVKNIHPWIVPMKDLLKFNSTLPPIRVAEFLKNIE